MIKNCHQLSVSEGSFNSGHLTVAFHNIKNLSLAAGSFETGNNGRVSITISNSNLNEIPGGMFKVSQVATITPTLSFQMADSGIGRIASAAFAKYKLDQLSITNTTIGHIDTGAIDNQVQQTLGFINNTFESLARRAMVLSSYHRNTKLVFDGNIFKGKTAINVREQKIT